MGELEIILRVCTSLRTLTTWGRLVNVPSNVLQYPSLRSWLSLDIPYETLVIHFLDFRPSELDLYCQFAPMSTVEEQLLKRQMAAPTQLQSLATFISRERFPIIVNLVTGCLSEPTPALKTLNISSGQVFTRALLPLASTIASHSPGYGDEKIDAIQSTATFLNKAHNLLHLHLRRGVSGETSLHLRALRCQLQSLVLELALQDDDKEENIEGIFLAIQESAKSEVLGTLSWITFEDVHAWELESIKGWKDLAVVLQQNGTKIFTE